MKRGTTRRSAVVGDRRPLERNLARFLLEERGFAVAAEASMAADVAAAVAEHRPDVLLVHENVATDRGESIIPAVRSSSSKTRVIVLTSDRAAAAPTLVAAADAVVEEGPGLKELESALSPARGRAAPARAAAGPIAFAAAAAKPRPTLRERGWIERLQGAAAASIIVLAVVLARGAATNPPAVDGEGQAHVAAAQEVLRSLEAELSSSTTADAAEVASLARTLLEERAAALAAGVDVTALDEQIAEALAPLLDTLPPDVAQALIQILGDLVTGGSPPLPLPEPGPSGEPGPEPEPQDGPEPTESPSPEVSPTEEPSPVETVTESPSPTETESPSPTETETPSPTDTETPSPTETESPSPTDTETPSPTGTETPSPTETETPSPTETEPPSPTETETPSPTETETPSPTQTETPSPTCPGGQAPAHDCEPSPTRTCDHDGARPAHECNSSSSRPSAGTIYVVPPGIALLLATSGLARRLARRRWPGR
jgi:AmiR/NasT family two-component response regulator